MDVTMCAFKRTHCAAVRFPTSSRNAESHAGHNKLQTLPNTSFPVKSQSKNFINMSKNKASLSSLSAFEHNGSTAWNPVFNVTVPKRTCDITHTHTCRQTVHIETFTLSLDFDPPSLCISYKLSEKTK